MGSNPSEIEQDIKKTFILECQENLDVAEECILALEKNTNDHDNTSINELFRALHTIKGGAGFMGMTKVTNLAHEMETLIGVTRDNIKALTPLIIETLLSGIDRLKEIFQAPSSSDAVDVSLIITTCQQLIQEIKSENKEDLKEEEVKPKEIATSSFDLNDYNLKDIENRYQYLFEGAVDLLQTCSGEDISLLGFFEKLTSVGEILDIKFNINSITNLKDDSEDKLPVSFLLETILDDPLLITEGLNLKATKSIHHNLSKLISDSQDTGTKEKEKISPPKTVSSKKQTPKPEPPKTALTKEKAIEPPSEIKETVNKKTEESVDKNEPKKKDMMADKGVTQLTIRIPVQLIEKLMNLASELVLLRNQNIQAISSQNISELTTVSQKLNMVTSEIQATIMQTRMQPIGSVFNLFKRIIRNLAIKLGKEIELEIIGETVELDKNIIDAISEPLTHLVRNSVDHGIESPEEREAAGKPPTGFLTLKAYHHAGQVILQITDDGKGMDPEELKNSALSKKLISRNQAEQMSSEEAFNLIFLPGFSSAKEITDISGRGVGMSVVKESFHRLGGIIDINSEKNVGTTITISLPLTLAIMPALIVNIENKFFAIPQVNIVEIVWLNGEETYQKIEIACNQEVYRLRGTLLPILRLSKVLKTSKTFKDPETGEKKEDRRTILPDRRIKDIEVEEERRAGIPERRGSSANNLYIIVLKLGVEQFGLIVDKIVDTQEIVVKPIHDHLKDCTAYAGVTFLGDGTIAMILDIANIATMGSYNLGSIDDSVAKKSKTSGDETHELLLFDIGGIETYCTPLWMIKRVDKISPADIQVVNKKEFLNFKDTVIPLFRIEKALDNINSKYRDDEIFVIIPNLKKTVGIIANNIIDAIETPATINDESIVQQGIMGSIMIDKKLSIFLDFFSIIERIEPGFLTCGTKINERSALLVDDSAIHISFISSLLRAEGIDIKIAKNGKQAKDILMQEAFDFIISDIEMPEMNGLELAKWVRQQERFRETPMLALSAADENKFEPLAYRAGFNRFSSKLNHDALIKAVKEYSIGSPKIIEKETK